MKANELSRRRSVLDANPGDRGRCGLGAWTFIYKEIVVPKSAPVNVTVDLELKKISAGAGGENKKKLIPVQFRVSAKNPSTREIYLLPSVWMATGTKISPGDNDIGDVPAITSSNEQTVAQRHAAVNENVIIAFGGLVEDDSLKPNEVTTRTFILYVPPNEYDSIDLLTIVPTIAEEGKDRSGMEAGQRQGADRADLVSAGREGGEAGWDIGG